jgi:hypothetical protein
MPAESATAAAIHHGFIHAPEPWQAALVLAAAAVAAWWAWNRYGPAPAGWPGRIARACRAAALAALVLCLAGPARFATHAIENAGTAVIAVDTSLSMARGDGEGGEARIAAADRLARALAGSPLRPDWVRIGGAGGGFDPREAAGLSATGASSPLGDELERLVAARRPDLLVVVSDFRTTHGLRPEAAAAGWGLRDLRFAALATGGDRIDPELWIDEVVANREAALDEREPVRVRLGLRAATGPVQVVVRVDGVEAGTRLVAGEADPTDPARAMELSADLQVVYPRAGTSVLEVVATGTGLQRTARIQVAVQARPLSVLMLAHRPTYELRYLREALRRDRTASVHAYLADGRWRRWAGGSDREAGPEVVPVEGPALAAYDVVVLGDLAADAFRPNQLAAIADAVRKQALGLVWMTGETGAVASYARTPLADLVPAEVPDAAAIARGYLSERQGLLEPGDTPWESLPSLRGALALTAAAVRPGAEVLAEDQDGNPLVVARSYGAGRAVLLAVDDAWRWRRGVGDQYLHRFHSQLLRFAAAGRRSAGQPWRLQVQPRRTGQGDLVAITLLPTGPGIEPPAAQAAVRLTGPGRERVVALAREGAGYAARIAAPEPGTWTIATAGDPPAPGVDLQVTPPALETRDPRRDLAAATALATALGGSVHTTVEDLVAALPKDLTVREEAVTATGLWDTWQALALVIALLAIDWAIRRALRFP